VQHPSTIIYKQKTIAVETGTGCSRGARQYHYGNCRMNKECAEVGFPISHLNLD
jgi:hypothetical protein